MTRALFALLALALTACPKPLPPPGPIPPAQADAGATDADEAKRPCLAVCRRLSKLGCPAAKPTAEGTSCTVVCENVQSSGVIAWKLDCMKVAESCEAADRCNQ